MKILFLHRSFPGQFQHLAIKLAEDPNNEVMFITDDKENQVKGVKKFIYSVNAKVPDSCHPYLRNYAEAVLHGQAAASLALSMKQQGIKPDVIYGFSGWGNAMFMKEIFPDTPFISYYEWYYNADAKDIEYSKINLTEDDRANIRCKNSKLLIDLYSSDAGLSPTHWQKSQFPKEFQHKIKVLHDGIDTTICKPDSEAKFLIKDKNIELTAQDEVITYATRGMEPYRGFPQFMEAAANLLLSRPNAHIVIAGADFVCYGQELEQGSYKELMLKKYNIDLNRVHFVGMLTFEEYVKLLQISSVHVYLTFPYILSWSFLEAMSTGCCIVASSTEPVLEVMENNYNGLLVDFFDTEQLVGKIEYALDNKEKMQEIRNNARQTVIENYSLEKLLPEHIEFIKSVVSK